MIGVLIFDAGRNANLIPCFGFFLMLIFTYKRNLTKIRMKKEVYSFFGCLGRSERTVSPARHISLLPISASSSANFWR